MPDTLREVCQLVAEVAVARGNAMATGFQQQLEEKAQVDLSQEQLRTAVIGFAFTNWAFANGVWSNLRNTKLRRDLMATSKTALILQTARSLCESDNQSDVAYLATNLELDQFRPFAEAYTERIKQLDEAGTAFHANAALLFGLEWIQIHLGLSDSVMDAVAPAFLTQIGDPEEVERVAYQVNRAAEDRPNKGLLARFLDGWRSGSASE